MRYVDENAGIPPAKQWRNEMPAHDLVSKLLILGVVGGLVDFEQLFQT
jgi:hypothetical protein